MRKHQQKQILEFIQTLKEATEEIKRLFSRKEFPNIIQLLADCQASAVEIGNFIEEIAGEGTKSVAFLEEYCELLYQISNGLENAEANFTKKIKKQLIKIESSVHGELRPDKIEMVFLPYKASMWDSMESVWLAAKDDPQCDAYVVPIPYFDRLPGGAMGEMHYEGGQYPAYVPVIDWLQYDMEARHPDAVFIHNPYDASNLVTSVHPEYYSWKLKQKTDVLAYIDYGLPYWMWATPVESDVNLLPAIKIVDIFVTYAKQYAAQLKVHLKHAFPSEAMAKLIMTQCSIVALGSPKFDAVLKARREDCPLPEDWKLPMAGKKVLLFSTSVGAILQGNESFIERLRSVMRTMRSHEDILLWWRPHPLSISTFATMRPHLLAEYESIVEEYRKEGWGIYDDTPDFHRAIAWSDACYTDESSLLLLYLATGKPFTVRTFAYSPEEHITDNSLDFTPILDGRIKNMQSAKGADVCNYNCMIWWHNFVDADFIRNVQYDNFLERYIHFILHESEYPQAQLYRQLKLEMFHEFVENSDGTAGQKIFEFTKRKILG